MYCTRYLSLNIKISNFNTVFGLFLNFVKAYEKEFNAQMYQEKLFSSSSQSQSLFQITIHKHNTTQRAANKKHDENKSYEPYTKLIRVISTLYCEPV